MTQKAKVNRKPKKNIAGFYDASGVFRPIRSGISKPSGSDRQQFIPGYDPEQAGDNDDIFDKEIRREKNIKKAVAMDEKRQLEAALEDALGEERKVSLSQFVRNQGGLYFDEKNKTADSGELRKLSFKETGKKGIAHKNGKYSPDQMREAADIAGYTNRDGLPLSTVDDFLTALDQDLNGKRKIYPFGTDGAYKYNPAKLTKSQYWTRFAANLLRLEKLHRTRKQIAKANKLLRLRRIALAKASEAKGAEKMKAAKTVKTNSAKAKTAKKAVKKTAQKTVKKTAKKKTTAKPKKNGLLGAAIGTAASLAVGTAAVLGIYDRFKDKQPVNKKQSQHGAEVLKHNRGEISPKHEGEFKKLLDQIENGDLSKEGAARAIGRLAGYEKNELDRAIQYARLTYKLKQNPSAADVTRAQNSLLKPNSMASRAWGRYKAGQAYKRQLRLEAQIERTKKRRAKHEARAKKNPGYIDKNFLATLTKVYQNGKNSLDSKKVTRQDSWVIADNPKYLTFDGETAKVTGEGIKLLKPHLRKNPAESATAKAYQDFQGRPSTKDLEIATPEITPRHVWIIGLLLEIRLKGKKTLNFRREVTGRNFYLVSDGKKEKLYIGANRTGDGCTIFADDPGIRKGESVFYATIDKIVYKTKKNHLGDTRPGGYIHELGDEGGEKPDLCRDRNGAGIIEGGDYYIAEPVYFEEHDAWGSPGIGN